jgi:hypothetical protein
MAIRDTLKHKWDSITPRERNLVVLLGIAVPVILLLYMGLGIGDKLDAMEASNAKMRRALNVLAAIRAQGGPSQKAPTGPDIPDQPVKLESYLDRAAQKVGINVPSYKPHSPLSKGNGFVMHTVDLSVQGLTIEQTKDFLEAIETDNKLVVVTALDVKKNFSDKEKVDIKLEVSTYAKEAPAGGAGSGSGSASGSAGPVPGAKP